MTDELIHDLCGLVSLTDAGVRFFVHDCCGLPRYVRRLASCAAVRHHVWPVKAVCVEANELAGAVVRQRVAPHCSSSDRLSAAKAGAVALQPAAHLLLSAPLGLFNDPLLRGRLPNLAPAEQLLKFPKIFAGQAQPVLRSFT